MSEHCKSFVHQNSNLILVMNISYEVIMSHFLPGVDNTQFLWAKHLQFCHNKIAMDYIYDCESNCILVSDNL